MYKYTYKYTSRFGSAKALRLPLRTSFETSTSVFSRQFTSSRLHGSRPYRGDWESSNLFSISDEVRHALKTHMPVVALETTIYTHGFPYPDNLALASHLESVVRLNGAIPATIGILNGGIKIGMTPEELTELVSSAGKTDMMKVSIRDLPYIAGLGLAGTKMNGGTTVAATALLAAAAGIRVFATGGLGGVHRGGQDTMDISADLRALGSIPIAVISSGCKSFLDIPRTLEYLETEGVPVVTFADGRTGDIDFPAFWTRESGVKSPMVVQNAEQAAAVIFANMLISNRLSYKAILPGMLFANPIPEEWSLPKADMDAAIDSAVKEAAELGFHGNRNTPFILSRIKDLTEGKSVPANRALVESNVAMGAKIAVELRRLQTAAMAREGKPKENQATIPTKAESNIAIPPPISQASIVEEHAEVKLASKKPLVPSKTAGPPAAAISPTGVDILVAGSVAVDTSCNYSPFDKSADASPLPHTSNPAAISRDVGGVGFNVALAAHLTYGANSRAVRLCTLVATDSAGRDIQEHMSRLNLDCSGVKALETSATTRTAQYVAVNDTNKDLCIAMADMGIFSAPRDDFKEQWQPLIDEARPKWIVVDANWHVSTFMQWIAAANAVGAKVAFEPVSVAKSQIIFPDPSTTKHPPLPVFPHNPIHLATPNIHELAALHTTARDRTYLERQDWWAVIDALGIPSTGARDRLVQLTSAALVDAGVPQMCIQLLPFIPTIITKLGADGCLVTELLPPDSPKLTSPAHAPYILSRSNNGTDFVGGVYMRHYAAEPLGPDGIVSVNGAGDTFLGALVAQLARGEEVGEEVVGVAQKAAVETLGWDGGVSEDIGGGGVAREKVGDKKRKKGKKRV